MLNYKPGNNSSVHLAITHALKRPDLLQLALDKADAEASLLRYAKLMWSIIEPGREMKVGWAVEAICEHLEAVTSGKLKRLLINVPPGMMKSLLTNVFWPSWEWGPKNRPDLRYVSFSYSHDLTIRDNRRSRQLMESELYQLHWGDRFSFTDDQNAKVRFDNDKRGFRIATSVAGLGTGERGDRLVVDDPHNVKTAESEAKLTEVMQWFTEVLPTRVNDLEESARVVIMQRVHERDVSGLILAQELGYEHLMLPMEFEPERRCTTSIGFTDPRRELGELLFPERFTQVGVDNLKKELSSWGGEYAVAGQLQQRPSPRGGGMFKRKDIEVVEFAPPGGREVRGWDLAGSKDKLSPFTAGVKLKKVRGTIYVTHVTKGQWTPGVMENRMDAVVKADGKACRQSIPQDPGQAGKSQKHSLAQKWPEYDVRFSPESGSKEDRAMPVAAASENGLLKIVKGDWNEAFLSELAMFPRGIFKDQVDALSRAYMALLALPKEEDVDGGETIGDQDGEDIASDEF
jgi:predicted phage terminase large subunit-like protein